MGCSKKIVKILDSIVKSHYNAMVCQHVTLAIPVGMVKLRWSKWELKPCPEGWALLDTIEKAGQTRRARRRRGGLRWCRRRALPSGEARALPTERRRV